jgi:8-oxo-dGTP diphosphatase
MTEAKKLTSPPTWEPTVRANLCFVVNAGRILLIRKKRGFGAGKINGPGGKVDPGETPMESAIRETFEELCVTPIGVRQAGELFFEFLDGMRLHCVVFAADDVNGEARETDEAVPLWTDLDAIPYDEMWADDRFWLPHLIRGEQFRGTFLFDGEKLLDRRIEVIPPVD